METLELVHFPFSLWLTHINNNTADTLKLVRLRQWENYFQTRLRRIKAFDGFRCKLY